MNKEKLLSILCNLEKDIAACKLSIEADFLRTTISGEPAIVHDLQAAVIKIMMAAK